MSETANATTGGGSTLVKSIDWKQGVIIAMGVPILILPSIFDLNAVGYAFTIIIWTLSVIQGFLQNMAIGEMSAALEVPGIGACAQTILGCKKGYKGKVNWGKFLGAFTAWTYWFTWTPVIPIFTIMAGAYLQEFVPFLADVNSIALNLILGVLIYGLIIATGSKGLEGGARLGLVLAAVTIIPLFVIVLIPFFNGGFEMSYIVNEFLPPSWNWNIQDIMMIFGMFAVAQWSACAWESAATYGAEYKEPGKNLPKALISCGLICLVVYFLVSFSVYGCLGAADQGYAWVNSAGETVYGVQGIGYATLVPVAVMDFGDIGSWIALFLLVAGMVMLIQTAFLGSSRTLYFMAHSGNMPSILGRTNKNDAPIYAMIFQFIVGMCLIPLGTPGMILAASSYGFSLALGMAMVCFVKFRKDEHWADVRDKREYIAPKGWYYVAWGIMIYQFCFLIPGLTVYCVLNEGIGSLSVIIAIIILMIYIPIWLFLHHKDPDYIKQSGCKAEKGEECAE